MLKFIAVFALVGSALAQPEIGGVWRGDLTKSSGQGRATDYVVSIASKGTAITIKTLIVQTPANARSEATYDPSIAQTKNWIRGNPTRSRAAWDGNMLRIDSTFEFGGEAQNYREEYTLKPDGTLELVRTQGAAPIVKIVFAKAPGATAEFDKPEKPAREAYQNVSALNVPASSLLGIMNTYCLSLGVVCAHCHVNGQWASDDNPVKATARKMIVMTRELNQQNFSPRVGVSCFTCHRGNAKPALVPVF